MSAEPTVRFPAVAGQFYERDSNRLRNQIEQCFLHDLGPGKLPETPLDDDEGRILGVISPHAGYMFSGRRRPRCSSSWPDSLAPKPLWLCAPTIPGGGSGSRFGPVASGRRRWEG